MRENTDPIYKVPDRTLTSRKRMGCFARRIAYRHPIFFLPLYFRLERERKSLVGYKLKRRALFDQNYDLHIEGFWRSGNTFFTTVIEHANPQLVVRSYGHKPVYAVQSIRWRKPVCILIRDPQEVIPSFALHYLCGLDEAIEEYIVYYEPLTTLTKQALILPFELITTRTAEAVNLLAEKYNIGIQTPMMSPEFILNVENAVKSKSNGANPRTVSLPNPERQQTLTILRQTLKCETRYNRRLTLAKSIYNIITQSGSK